MCRQETLGVWTWFFRYYPVFMGENGCTVFSTLTPKSHLCSVLFFKTSSRGTCSWVLPHNKTNEVIVFFQETQQYYTGVPPFMASLPGGEMETLLISRQEGLRTRAQTEREKKLKRVWTMLLKYCKTYTVVSCILVETVIILFINIILLFEYCSFHNFYTCY